MEGGGGEGERGTSTQGVFPRCCPVSLSQGRWTESHSQIDLSSSCSAAESMATLISGDLKTKTLIGMLRVLPFAA